VYLRPPISLLAEALERTAAQRDQVVIDSAGRLIQGRRADPKIFWGPLMRDQNDAIFRQLEERQ